MFKNIFAKVMVSIQNRLGDWNESRKAAGKVPIGLHEITWKMKWLRCVFPERWLYEWMWQLVQIREERRFWRYLTDGFKRFGRPLSVVEKERLTHYERNYTEIRVQFMPSHTTIGGLCIDYIYFSEDSRNDDKKVLRLLFHEGEFDTYITPNQYMSDKFDEYFERITKENCSFWYEYLMRNNKRVIVETSFHYKRRQYNESRYFFMEKGKIIPHKAFFAFSADEMERGQAAMQKIGISEPYICIFARDGRYNVEMSLVSTWENESLDLRNSDIYSFKQLTHYFGEKEIQSVRMGALVESKYQLKGAVDYANTGRTDFLDVFIFSKCLFFIGDASGIGAIPFLLGRPIVYINIYTLLWCMDYVQPMTLGIFLKYYDPVCKCYLRMKKWVEVQIRCFIEQMDFHAYMRQHYEIIHNTSEEILDVAKEMEAIHNHTIQYTEHDEELQQRYRVIVKSIQSLFPIVECPYPGRIGMQWLRDNEWFLE